MALVENPEQPDPIQSIVSPAVEALPRAPATMQEMMRDITNVLIPASGGLRTIDGNILDSTGHVGHASLSTYGPSVADMPLVRNGAWHWKMRLSHGPDESRAYSISGIAGSKGIEYIVHNLNDKDAELPEVELSAVKAALRAMHTDLPYIKEQLEGKEARVRRAKGMRGWLGRKKHHAA
jgi:hypothetical protein